MNWFFDMFLLSYTWVTHQTTKQHASHACKTFPKDRLATLVPWTERHFRHADKYAPCMHVFVSTCMWVHISTSPTRASVTDRHLHRGLRGHTFHFFCRITLKRSVKNKWWYPTLGISESTIRARVKWCRNTHNTVMYVNYWTLPARTSLTACRVNQVIQESAENVNIKAKDYLKNTVNLFLLQQKNIVFLIHSQLSTQRCDTKDSVNHAVQLQGKLHGEWSACVCKSACLGNRCKCNRMCQEGSSTYLPFGKWKNSPHLHCFIYQSFQQSFLTFGNGSGLCNKVAPRMLLLNWLGETQQATVHLCNWERGEWFWSHFTV